MYNQPGQPSYAYAVDNFQNVENGNYYEDVFSDRAIRHAFISKVYSILALQMIITCGIVSIFVLVDEAKQFVIEYHWTFYISLVFSFGLMIAMSCCVNLRRQFPMNFILLALLTIAMSYTLSCVTALYETTDILMALGVTAAAFIALTIFAFQTKWDITLWGSGLLIASVCLLLLGLIAMLVQVKILSLVYAAIGVVLFCLYIVYDTQLLLSGTHGYSISPEEYIFAALSLYTDVVNLFLMLLTIIGIWRE